jgi:hypothetical protein
MKKATDTAERAGGRTTKNERVKRETSITKSQQEGIRERKIFVITHSSSNK